MRQQFIFKAYKFSEKNIYKKFQQKHYFAVNENVLDIMEFEETLNGFQYFL